jgi:hypothetical protein
MTPRVLDSPKAAAADTREHSSRLSALSNFSLGDMFRDGSKSTKFPEKLLKVLEQKLQDIAMRKDPVCAIHLHLLHCESFK